MAEKEDIIEGYLKVKRRKTPNEKNHPNDSYFPFPKETENAVNSGRLPLGLASLIEPPITTLRRVCSQRHIFDNINPFPSLSRHNYLPVSGFFPLKLSGLNPVYNQAHFLGRSCFPHLRTTTNSKAVLPGFQKLYDESASEKNSQIVLDFGGYLEDDSISCALKNKQRITRHVKEDGCMTHAPAKIHQTICDNYVSEINLSELTLDDKQLIHCFNISINPPEIMKYANRTFNIFQIAREEIPDDQFLHMASLWSSFEIGIVKLHSSSSRTAALHSLCRNENCLRESFDDGEALPSEQAKKLPGPNIPTRTQSRAMGGFRLHQMQEENWPHSDLLTPIIPRPVTDPGFVWKSHPDMASVIDERPRLPSMFTMHVLGELALRHHDDEASKERLAQRVIDECAAELYSDAYKSGFWIEQERRFIENNNNHVSPQPSESYSQRVASPPNTLKYMEWFLTPKPEVVTQLRKDFKRECWASHRKARQKDSLHNSNWMDLDASVNWSGNFMDRLWFDRWSNPSDFENKCDIYVSRGGNETPPEYERDVDIVNPNFAFFSEGIGHNESMRQRGIAHESTAIGFLRSRGAYLCSRFAKRNSDLRHLNLEPKNNIINESELDQWWKASSISADRETVKSILAVASATTIDSNDLTNFSFVIDPNRGNCDVGFDSKNPCQNKFYWQSVFRREGGFRAQPDDDFRMYVNFSSPGVGLTVKFTHMGSIPVLPDLDSLNSRLPIHLFKLCRYEILKAVRKNDVPIDKYRSFFMCFKDYFPTHAMHQLHFDS